VAARGKQNDADNDAWESCRESKQQNSRVMTQPEFALRESHLRAWDSDKLLQPKALQTPI
jgi:hypothetical protein